MSLTPLLPPLVSVGSVQGTLALRLEPNQDLPFPPAEVVAVGPGPEGMTSERVRRRRVAEWARLYAQAVIEIIEGDRPLSQLLRWSAPEVYNDLARRAQLIARAAGHQAGLGGRPGPVVRAHVQGVRTCFVGPDSVEVSVHVRHGERSRALAARFDLVADRWQCTALEFA